MQKTVIEVSEFSKNYGATLAVDGLSFEIGRGEILGLVGPNGAGKTTTLKALAGILSPTRGRLAIEGFDVVTDPIAAKRRVALIPDEAKLFDTLTVWEHLEFTAATYCIREFAADAEQLMQLFELTERRHSLAQELSRGMRQKVAIACAYLYQPQVLLFDEPLTGLDPGAIRTLRESICDRAQNGAAVIISSHLLSLVEELCSHLLVLDRGRRLFFGSVQEARATFTHLENEPSLEQVFFSITGQQEKIAVNDDPDASESAERR